MSIERGVFIKKYESRIVRSCKEIASRFGVKNTIPVFFGFEKNRVIDEWSVIQFVHRFSGHVVFLTVIQVSLYPCAYTEHGNMQAGPACDMKRDKKTIFCLIYLPFYHLSTACERRKGWCFIDHTSLNQ
jgi:hypothetical protein